MLLDANQSQLLLIDYQARLMPAISGGEHVLANAHRLGTLARLLHIPVLGTEQTPAKLGALVPAVGALCDETITKNRFSAEHVLAAPLHARGERKALVVAGCEAHVCLMQTALDLNDADWSVWIVTDACGSRSPHNRDAAFARLAAAGCRLITTEMAGFEWLRDAEHDAFHAWQKMIR